MKALDLTHPRVLFVWLAEARELFTDLDALAADATLPKHQRKLSRAEARELYERARTGLAWLLEAAEHEEIAASTCGAEAAGGAQ
jgi:hypothetical protein